MTIVAHCLQFAVMMMDEVQYMVIIDTCKIMTSSGSNDKLLNRM